MGIDRLGFAAILTALKSLGPRAHICELGNQRLTKAKLKQNPLHAQQFT